MSKRKSLLSPEQQKLLEKLRNQTSDVQPSNTNQNQKASSNAPKPQIRRSGSRGK